MWPPACSTNATSAPGSRLLAHRAQHRDVLEWLLFLNTRDEFSYWYGYGDKDTFLAAFMLAGKQEQYYQVGMQGRYRRVAGWLLLLLGCWGGAGWGAGLSWLGQQTTVPAVDGWPTLALLPQVPQPLSLPLSGRLKVGSKCPAHASEASCHA